MRKKIKEALQQGHKNLGLSEEVFERVAASVETFITEEADIDKYVNSELVKSLLKFEQADADRKRAKREGEKKEPDNGNQTPPEDKQPEDKGGEMAQLIKLMQEQNEQMRKQNEALTARFDAFEAAQSQKSAVAALDELKGSWDYAKGYPAECEDAYERVMELYEVGGKKWSADELTAKFKEKFNKAVSKKGVDTTKPFESDGGGGKTPDFKDEVELLRGAGVEMPE